MNLLLTAVPLAYRWLALVLAALMLLAFGFMKGVQHEEGAQAVRELKTERAATVLVGKRTDLTNKVDLKYAPALTQIRTVTKETIKEVTKYVKATDCALSGGFRVYHDAAAAGRTLPDPAGNADAAAVSATDAAVAVADNYGTCLANAKQLEGLQEWIREQQKLNPKE